MPQISFGFIGRRLSQSFSPSLPHCQCNREVDNALKVVRSPISFIFSFVTSLKYHFKLFVTPHSGKGGFLVANHSQSVQNSRCRHQHKRQVGSIWKIVRSPFVIFISLFHALLMYLLIVHHIPLHQWLILGHRPLPDLANFTPPYEDTREVSNVKE